ncbi:MAG: hypothetical protein CFH44_01068 [Proteobacteria bacterium]|nr:MAG: hypothetical protein CFH44_01068 [Pseudomonadota bacterium]|tara:strand:+ start:843 stop:1331 length:489 start_codon:yes stop_codon:yes gene_type:complete
MSYKVSKLTSEKLEETAKVYEFSIKDNPKGFIQDIDYHGSVEKMDNDFSANNGGIYILEDENTVIGMGALRNVDGETAELCKLHILPEHKGKGLGKKLAIELMQQAKDKGFSKTNLHVTITQKAAIGLYEKLGFKKYHQEIYKLDHNGQNLEFDTIFMEKNI